MSVTRQIGTNNEIAKPQEDNFLYFAMKDCDSLPVCKQDFTNSRLSGAHKRYKYRSNLSV